MRKKYIIAGSIIILMISMIVYYGLSPNDPLGTAQKNVESIPKLVADRAIYIHQRDGLRVEGTVERLTSNEDNNYNMQGINFVVSRKKDVVYLTADQASFFQDSKLNFSGDISVDYSFYNIQTNFVIFDTQKQVLQLFNAVVSY